MYVYMCVLVNIIVLMLVFVSTSLYVVYALVWNNGSTEYWS